jgi:hypothetical protein
MPKILGLDISSSTIGYSVFEFDNKTITLLNYGYIKPPNKSKGSISLRLEKTGDLIRDLLLKFEPDYVAVEDYAKRFSAGRSHANTIIILSVFNEQVCLECFKYLKKDVYRYPVLTIRSQMSKLLNVKIVSKDDIYNEILKHCNIFKSSFNKNGTMRKEDMDVVDSMAVSLTFILKEHNNGQSYFI